MKDYLLNKCLSPMLYFFPRNLIDFLRDLNSLGWKFCLANLYHQFSTEIDASQRASPVKQPKFNIEVKQMNKIQSVDNKWGSKIMNFIHVVKVKTKFLLAKFYIESMKRILWYEIGLFTMVLTDQQWNLFFIWALITQIEINRTKYKIQLSSVIIPFLLVPPCCEFLYYL